MRVGFWAGAIATFLTHVMHPAGINNRSSLFDKNNPGKGCQIRDLVSPTVHSQTDAVNVALGNQPWSLVCFSDLMFTLLLLVFTGTQRAKKDITAWRLCTTGT